MYDEALKLDEGNFKGLNMDSGVVCARENLRDTWNHNKKRNESICGIWILYSALPIVL